VQFFQPFGPLSGQGFVLLDGEENGAGFFVTGDGDRLLGGNLLEDVGRGVFQLCGSDGGEFLDAGNGGGGRLVDGAHRDKIANIAKIARFLLGESGTPRLTFVGRR
jgi:hypothetical protein